LDEAIQDCGGEVAGGAAAIEEPAAGGFAGENVGEAGEEADVEGV